MGNSLKQETFKGVLWSGLEKGLTYIVSFVVNLAMARMLTPADYGIVGIIAVFVSFSQLFIDGGFTTALISKKNRDELDFRTVFVFNLCSSIILYVILFITAPLIEVFYNLPGLEKIIRIYCLSLIISSFSAIQITRFTINVDFKSITKVTIPSNIIAGCIGILLAYMGYGVWAIVCQLLMSATLRVILAFYYSRWVPQIAFSKDRFKMLFGFSSKLVLSSLIDRIYTNSYPLFIGKFFPPATLGNYTRGQQFGCLPSSIMGDVVNRVTFPLMSRIQDENDKLVELYNKYIKLSSFVIFPLVMLVVVMAEPIVRILLTDKWIGCVRFMQIIGMALMMDHIGTINRNLLYVKQHSDYALRLEIIKKVIAISIFLLSTFWGIWGVVIGQWIYGMIAPILNALYTNRLINLSIYQQLLDYIGAWFLSVTSAFFPLWILSFVSNSWMQLISGFFSYIIIYILLNWLFHTESLAIIYAEVKIKLNSGPKCDSSLRHSIRDKN